MIYKRGQVYWYKFSFGGQGIRQSTRQGNDKVARNMESAHRARLAGQSKDRDAARERLQCAEVLTCHECEKLFNAEKAIRKDTNVFCTAKCADQWGKARTMPTLEAFLNERFIPDAETRHKAKPMTVRYYRQGADMLIRSKLFGLRLDEITSEHAGQFAAEFRRLSPSGINRGLRTLRRAMNLAHAWGQTDKPVKVELAKGENQRDRVLTDEELEMYLNACSQPWKDAALIISEEGMRPGEVFALRWPHVLICEDGTGLIRVVEGKSKAARRILPMTPGVHAALKARHEAQGSPADGWVFPTGSIEGHLTGDGAKESHARALTDSKVAPFVPYVLRHTALTRLGKATNGDVFALARIAGHSSITITQRYVHTQADTIEGIFSRAVEAQAAAAKATAKRTKRLGVGTNMGTAKTKAEQPPSTKAL
jgi:integrase